MQGRILSESELKELFQNYTLNVNIGRNKALLSRVKRDFESDKPYKKYLGKQKIAKGLALTLVAGCLVAFVFWSFVDFVFWSLADFVFGALADLVVFFTSFN